MGFNIGGLLSGLGSIAAPLIGGAFGGPAGALVGAQVASVVSGAAGQPTPVRVATVRANGATVPTSSIVGGVATTPSTAVAPIPVAGAMIPFAMGGAAAIAQILRQATIVLGKRVTSTDVLALVRSLGLTAASLALGISVADIARVVAAKPRRRRRGITAANLATTRKTLRKVMAINRTLSEFRPPPSRRSTGRRISQTKISN